MKIALFFIAFLLIVPPVNASSIGIGVEPSKLDVELTSVDPLKTVSFKIWNEGDTSTNFTIIPTVGLKNFTDFTETTYFIGSNTSRFENYTTFQMRFIKMSYGSREVETGFYVRASAPPNVTIGIIPQVFVKIKIRQIEDGRFTPEQIRQAYSSSLGSNYTNFTWWSSLWNETTLRAEHPEMNETGQTQVQETQNNTWVFVVAVVVVVIVVAIVTFYFWEYGF